MDWAPITVAGNNAWSRLLVRLGEIEQCLQLLSNAGNKSVNTFASNITIPTTGMGNGLAKIEGARGELLLKFHIHAGKLAYLNLSPASAALAAYVNPMTKQMELSDALLAVNSLDILPHELNFKK